MIDFAHLGWREGVVVVVGVVALYLVLMVLRLLKVGKSSPRARAAVPPEPTFGGADEDVLVDLSRSMPPGLVSSSAAAKEDEDDWPLAGFAAVGGTAWAGGRAPASNSPAPDFARELGRTNVEVEVQQLRRESTALRDEVARLREELSSLKAARNVSPLYSEAMSLAQNGVSADGIAGQCGISLAEAELVAALARGEPEEDETYPSDEDQNDGYPDPRSRTGTHG